MFSCRHDRRRRDGGRPRHGVTGGAAPTGLRSVEARFRLTSADHLSPVALLFAWDWALRLASGKPTRGVVVMLVAFLINKLGGAHARYGNTGSAPGRQIDACIDAFVYPLTGSLLFHFERSPHALVSVAGSAAISVGDPWLVGHTDEGFGEEGPHYLAGAADVAAAALCPNLEYGAPVRPH